MQLYSNQLYYAVRNIKSAISSFVQFAFVRLKFFLPWFQAYLIKNNLKLSDRDFEIGYFYDFLEHI